MNIKREKIGEIIEKINLDLVDVPAHTASCIEDKLELIMKILCNVPKSGICPVCGENEKIEFETVDVNYENCFQRCKCTKCGTEFDEVFEYAGQKIIKK